jgi:type IV pilus modification protein PilV
MTKSHRQKGFSILEALLGLVILAIGVVAITIMLDTAITAGGISKEYTTAADLAADMMDTIRYQVFTDKGINATRLSSFDNDGSTDIIMSTLYAAPANEPAQSAFTRWQSEIRGNLPKGEGSVTIEQNHPDYAGNTYVEVLIEWESSRMKGWDAVGLDTRKVRLGTVLYQ